MFKSKTHETNFYNAMKEVDSDNYATQAIIYLLTSETTLWGNVKKHFKDGYIDVLAFHPKGGGLTGAFEDTDRGVKLPHLAGTITNLDGAAVKRSLISIQSELRRRQPFHVLPD